ncbi:MAG: prenyltransferase [Candidatus Diapherotrites archaeon]
MKKNIKAGPLTLDIIKLGRFQFILGGFLLYIFGAQIAHLSGIELSFDRILLGYLVLFFSHLSVSYSNDYFDFETDKNNERSFFSGGSGILLRSPKLRELAKKIAIVLITLSFLTAIMLVLFFDFSPIILVFSLIGNFCGWYYSAPPLKFSKKLYGNLIFAAVVGLMVPTYGNFVSSGTITMHMIIFSTPLLFYGFAFTLSVQLPDIENDKKIGKKNFAIIFGKKSTLVAIALLHLFASMSLLLYSFIWGTYPYLAIFAFSLLPSFVSLMVLLAGEISNITKANAFISSSAIFMLLCNLYLLI